MKIAIIKYDMKFKYTAAGDQENKSAVFKGRPGLIPGLCLSALLLFLIFPCAAPAEEAIIKMAFLENIQTDEDENPLHWPTFVYPDPVTDELYVIDGKGRFIIYTSDLFPVFTVGREKGIEHPTGLAVDHDGSIYISLGPTKDDPRPKIAVINACLRLDREIYLSGFEGAESFVPHRLAVDGNGLIYVTGSYTTGLLVLENDGSLREMFLPRDEGRPVKLSNVNIDRTGRIYLTSIEEGRIYVYDGDLNYLFKFGEKGGGPGKLSRPAGVAVDTDLNLIYVTDTMRHAVNVYDVGGRYLFEFGGLGWGDEWFQYPRDLTVDQKGRLFVADTFNNRISIYYPGTEILDSKRRLFLVDKFRGRISLTPRLKKLPVEGRLIDRLKDKMTKLKDRDMTRSVPVKKELIDLLEHEEELLIPDLFKSRVQLNVPRKESRFFDINTLISGISSGQALYASAMTRDSSVQ